MSTDNCKSVYKLSAAVFGLCCLVTNAQILSFVVSKVQCVYSITCCKYWGVTNLDPNWNRLTPDNIILKFIERSPTTHTMLEIHVFIRHFDLAIIIQVTNIYNTSRPRSRIFIITMVFTWFNLMIVIFIFP